MCRNELIVQLSPLPREVAVGVIGIVGCMDLCLRTVILMDDIKSKEIQSTVATILDISDESMTRGHYAGYVSSFGPTIMAFLIVVSCFPSRGLMAWLKTQSSRLELNRCSNCSKDIIISTKHCWN
jgi:hypothetical protein